MKAIGIPEYLIVAAAGEFEPGLAVGIQFGMRKKNDYLFITFIFESPITLAKATLLGRFDRIRDLFQVDYADPREFFNGTIEVKTLSHTEIRDAIKNYNFYAKAMAFPARYLHNLESALLVNPESDCLVACEKVY